MRQLQVPDRVNGSQGCRIAGLSMNRAKGVQNKGPVVHYESRDTTSAKSAAQKWH